MWWRATRGRSFCRNMTRTGNELGELLTQLARSVEAQGELGEAGVSKALLQQIDETVADEKQRLVAVQDSAKATNDAPSPPPDTPSEPMRPTLDAIREELGDCRRCGLNERRQNIVYGVGSPTADLMFIGEAPGADEDRKGEPFVGRAGQLLTRMIKAMGLERKDVYIANVIKCRPPGNRDPEPDEVLTCEPFLIRQIQAIRPKVIVTLGRVSASALFRRRVAITRERGRWNEYQGVRLMPTFHPAYLLRNPAAKREVWDDLQAVMAELGLSPP